jgi:hypothetical protein
MNKPIFVVSYLFILATIALGSPADSSITNQKMVTVVPGPEYEAGWWHKVFFGSQWRSLWITPIDVPVLDMKNFGNGLDPIKRGGGFQTKSLHFKANNGKYYKFRSIDKDPEKVLPQYFRDTFVSDIVQDMISTANPLSAVIAAPLLNAVGVLNSQPYILQLPDDPKLGEYREDFKDVFGTFAENPKDDTEPELVFAGADRIVKNYKIFEVLEKDNDDQIDALEFLKARLMDVFLGDWDRHIGQWKWARFKEGKNKRWVPIPRDRDQAFSLYNGLIPWITTITVPQIEPFREDYHQVNDITWSGRYLDRRFLVSIDAADWDSITTFVHNRLTDQVIEDAVHRMPDEWFAKEGEPLIHILKMRRDGLPEISSEYHEMISKHVSIYTSNKREYAEINRLDDDQVQVLIYKKDKDTGGKMGEPFFSRTFHYDQTKEIRIDLQGGDDTAIISGEVDRSVTVIVTGGQGKDEIIDESIVNGYFLSITPFYAADTKSIIYDSGKKSTIIKGPSSKLIKEKAPTPKPFNPETDNINEKYEPQVEDRGHDWKTGIWVGYNSDDGLLIGGGPILYEYGYRANPYVYRMSLLLAYITNIETFLLDYKSEFYTVIKPLRTKVDFRRLTANMNFYGYGNETTVNQDLDDHEFYLSRPDLFDFNLSFDYLFSDKHYIWAGATYDNSEVKYDPGSILDTLNIENARHRSQMGLNFGYRLDTRDNELTPLKGVFIDFKSLNYPGFFQNEKKYNKMILDARTYIRTDFITTSSFAFRILGENLWGNYPLHMTAFLGGRPNLLGYERQRFAGDALAYGAVGLRSYLFPIKILVPGRFGFSLFAETGRVFYKDEDSNKWHPSTGGGFWMSFLDRQLTISIALANSSEGAVTYFTTGFLF